MHLLLLIYTCEWNVQHDHIFSFWCKYQLILQQDWLYHGLTHLEHKSGLFFKRIQDISFLIFSQIMGKADEKLCKILGFFKLISSHFFESIIRLNGVLMEEVYFFYSFHLNLMKMNLFFILGYFFVFVLP